MSLLLDGLAIALRVWWIPVLFAVCLAFSFLNILSGGIGAPRPWRRRYVWRPKQLKGRDSRSLHWRDHGRR